MADNLGIDQLVEVVKSLPDDDLNQLAKVVRRGRAQRGLKLSKDRDARQKEGAAALRETLLNGHEKLREDIQQLKGDLTSPPIIVPIDNPSCPRCGADMRWIMLPASQGRRYSYLRCVRPICSGTSFPSRPAANTG